MSDRAPWSTIVSVFSSSGRRGVFLELTLVVVGHSIILVGMLVSYLPQHVRIIQRRTAEGISPYYILLGTTSATSGFANILLLPQSRQDVACCSELETWNCLAGLLGIAQLGTQWICFGFMWAFPHCAIFRSSTLITTLGSDLSSFSYSSDTVPLSCPEMSLGLGLSNRTGERFSSCRR